jgi:uncharacterized protein (TIGR02270 family)
MFWTDIIEEHVEEAAFCYEQRRAAFASRQYRIETLAELDARLVAHLDALLLSEAEGWAQSVAGLESENDGPAFVAGWVALASGSVEWIGALAKALAAPKALRGLSAALRLAPGDGVVPALEKFAAADPLGPRALALDALAYRGRPVEPRAVQALLDAAKTAAIGAGLAIIGRRRIAALAGGVTRALEHPHPAVALAALRAALRLELPGALPALRARAAVDDPPGAEAVQLLGLAGDASDMKLLSQAARTEARGRAGVVALGRLGHAGGVETLIAATENAKLARVAGLALETLLGVDLVAAKLAAPKPPAAEGEEALALDPDVDLPTPDPKRIRAWWSERKTQPDRDARLRHGQPFAWDAVAGEARDGLLPDRDAALQEIALRLPAVAFVERSDWAARQRDATAGLAAEVAGATRKHTPGSWTSSPAQPGRS